MHVHVVVHMRLFRRMSFNVLQVHCSLSSREHKACEEMCYPANGMSPFNAEHVVCAQRLDSILQCHYAHLQPWTDFKVRQLRERFGM